MRELLDLLYSGLPENVELVFQLAENEPLRSKLREALAPLYQAWEAKNIRAIHWLKVKEFKDLFFVEALDLTDKRMKELPAVYSHLRQIQHIRAAQNLLTPLPYYLKDFKQLQSIILWKNKFEVWPEVLIELPKLKYLFLHDNQLTRIPKNIQEMQSLQYLLDIM